MAHRIRQVRGQALVMVTFALFAMVGLMGLAVDFGWAFFVEKSAQSAADAAALAAVKKVIDDSTVFPTDYRCTGTIAQCYATPTPCPSSGSLPRNLAGACAYAAQNGFTTSNARQNVTIVASDRNTAPTVNGCNPTVAHPPTAPCVDTEYWVTVRVSESVPQLFSAIFNNMNALVSARATAAVAESEVIGALILLNRENDASPELEIGRNLSLGGGPTVNVPGGIVLSSGDDQAGFINGTGVVNSPFTYIRDPGDYELRGGGTWTAEPENSSDPLLYLDPMRGKGQPALNPNQDDLPFYPVLNGELTETMCGGVCQPGNYFAYRVGKDGNPYASGERIRIPNDSNLTFSGGGFGDFVFFGGLYIDRSSVTFGPGRYVLAGTLAESDPVFQTTNNAFVRGGTSETSDAGRLFILTDSSYGGQLDATLAKLTYAPSGWTHLDFNRAELKSGASETESVKLYGLNPDNGAVPEELKTFGPVLVWQDQANSYVKYTESGQIDTSCAGATINNPCTNTPTREDAPKLDFSANEFAVWGGIIYQPRGAWSWIQAGSRYHGPLRIITGALQVQGNGELTLTSPTIPLTRLVAALIE